MKWALVIGVALGACNQGPRALPPNGPDAAVADAGAAVAPAASSVAAADAGPPADAAATVAAPIDDGSVRPRSEVVMAEWFSTGGGPRHPVEGGFDFSERVFADGRYEMRDDGELVSTKDGRFVTKKVPKIYRPSYQLTKVEMTAFEALVRKTVQGLAPRYDETSTDRGFYKFVFRIDGKEVRSELSGHLQEANPLTEFSKTFRTLHKERTKLSETVRAWTKSGAMVERTVDCSSTLVDALYPLQFTMFPHRNGKPKQPQTTMPAADAVLLEVKYFADGKLTDTYRVMGNGKVRGTDAKGAVVTDAQLTPDETQALVETVLAIDWNAPMTCK